MEVQAAPALPAPGTTWKRWGFRLAALCLVPLLVLGALEGALRLAGYGYPTAFFLKERLGDQTVFIENQKFGWQFFPPRAARTPQPMAFPARKEASILRIFVFGESAAMGDPEPAFGLARFLEVMLRTRYPEQRFEVLNVAMTAINSHAILSIARDCAGREGDFWIVYMGNNEVVGPYGAGTVFGRQAPPRWLVRTSLGLRRWRVVQWGEAGWRRLRDRSRHEASWGGMELFTSHQVRLTDARMRAVYTNFQKNLREIIETGRRSGAEVVVSTMLSNLRDCPPFASLHRPNLSENERKRWESAYQAGAKAAEAGEMKEALKAFEQALALDKEYAELHFYLARCQEALGEEDKARRQYEQARDWDGLRFRADTTLNDIIREEAARESMGAHLVDSAELLGGKGRIPGRDLLWEHVHLNLHGNYALARLLAEKVSSILETRNAAAQAWPDLKRCLQHLGFSDWDHYEVLEILRQRIERAPFTQQSNHQAEFQNHLDQMKKIRARLGPAQLEAAIKTGRAALTQWPGDWVLQERLARRLKQKGEADEAITLWESVIASLPHYAEAHCQMGLLKLRKGQAAEAAASLRRALQLKPDYPEALDGLGQVLASVKKFKEAIELYKKALELRPGYSEAHARLARAYEETGQIDAARAHYQESLRLKPDNWEASTGLGRLRDQQGGLSEEVAYYEKILAANPQDAQAHFNLGNALRGLGRLAEAQAHFHQAVRLKPNYAEAHNRLGFELARQGQDTEALRHFEEAVRLKPDLAEAHLNLGVALARLQRMDEAVTHFTEALRWNPQDATARKYLEEARRRGGRGTNDK